MSKEQCCYELSFRNFFVHCRFTVGVHSYHISGDSVIQMQKNIQEFPTYMIVPSYMTFTFTQRRKEYSFCQRFKS